MTKDETLKLALEALACSDDFLFDYHDCEPNNEQEQQRYDLARTQNKKAIEAIREALAQQEEPCKGANYLQASEQEPQYAGTARELFTNAAIERLDVRSSTKVYLGTPSVCEQPAHQEPVWDASAPMVVHPHPAFQATPPQSEPVIDKSAAIRIATSLGWEPKRTWVGLTNGDWNLTPYDTEFRAGAEWAETKLKEKNT